MKFGIGSTLLSLTLAIGAGGCRLPEVVSDGTDPKISVFAWSIEGVAKQKGISIAAAADRLKAEGISGFDAAYDDPKLDEYAATGLEPVSLYGFFRFLEADGAKSACDACVATAVRHGVPLIMCIPQDFTDGKDNEAEMRRFVEGLRYLADAAGRFGIKVMVENFGMTGNPGSYIKNIRRFLREVPGLCLALDSGNLYYANRGETALELMSLEKERIAHVHLKDFAEDHRTYVTLGRGRVGNRDFVAALRGLGYGGWFSLENLVGDDELEDAARQSGVLRFWFR